MMVAYILILTNAAGDKRATVLNDM